MTSKITAEDAISQFMTYFESQKEELQNDLAEKWNSILKKEKKMELAFLRGLQKSFETLMKEEHTSLSLVAKTYYAPHTDQKVFIYNLARKAIGYAQTGSDWERVSNSSYGYPEESSDTPSSKTETSPS